ncbi:DUF3793 family protein [Desulfosporosinus hippei]|uniref:DUF3793 family protein n=1 Tax=Desulfosporosinus hippei DSM 8344 TaxID=1121419 RepID=A0A1G8G0D3_9FIRM|nr:DUF3793 family protein [Desulfosporosinus hippei]SDH87696.1 Protein of unknown function [Desulfosporosinus hippei DSM 8344]
MLEQLEHGVDITHLADLIAWANDSTSQKKRLFLIENLAPLVLRIKPSVLMNVSYNDQVDWSKFKILFTRPKALQIREIRKLNGQLQVMFYQKDLLDSVLSQRAIQQFLRSLSYPTQYSLDSYLQVLKHRILSRKFPHEIGVFLGYPLKDVLGFMGLQPLPYKRTQGWRIYGDERPSDEVYENYRTARRMMRELVEHIGDDGQQNAIRK